MCRGVGGAKTTSTHQPSATRGAFFSPRRARVGLFFILKRRLGGDGGGSKPTPSRFSSSKHKTDEKEKLENKELIITNFWETLT